MPANVVKVLVELVKEGLSLDTLLGTTGNVYGESVGRTGDSSSEKTIARSRAVAELLMAVDRGKVKTQEFDAFVHLCNIAPETVEKAIVELGLDEWRRVQHTYPESGDFVYRFVDGRLIKFISPVQVLTSPLWLKAALWTTVLGLIAVAVAHYS